MNKIRQTTDDGQTTDSELAGGTSASPGTGQPPEVMSGETCERVREEWVEHEFEGDAELSISDLDAYYDDDHALSSISTGISENNVTALISPPGCGKSAFLRCPNRMNDRIEAACINGSVRLESEEIYQEGVNLVELRKRIGMIFQSSNPFPKSVTDNISCGPRRHGDLDTGLLANLLGRSDNGAIDELAERFPRQAALWDEVQNRPDDNTLGLSGGQQQRFCITRALATNPEMLLMDGPVLALDPIVTSEIEDLAHDLAEEYTVVIITHNMQQAARISDQTAAFLTGGKLVEYGDTDQVFKDPQSQRVEDHISGKFG